MLAVTQCSTCKLASGASFARQTCASIPVDAFTSSLSVQKPLDEAASLASSADELSQRARTGRGGVVDYLVGWKACKQDLVHLLAWEP